MKKILVLPALSLIILFSSCGSTHYYSQTYTTEPSGITYQNFYDDLSPYGQWISYQNYGYVWLPDVPSFRPYYSDGHWVYTDYGWTWVSNYSWGWAPFHYGRWLYDDSYGWMWIPGYQWAPAWVAWRGGGDYYGWAPLEPGINISVNLNYGSSIPDDYWCFVPQRYMTNPRVYDYYVNRNTNITIIRNTTIINNTRKFDNRHTYIAGPSSREVEGRTNERIQSYRLEQRNAPGNTEISSSSVSIYRPSVRENQGQNEQFRPRKIGDLNEIKARRPENRANENRTPSDNRDNRILPNETNPPRREDQRNVNPPVNRNQDVPVRNENKNQKPPDPNNNFNQRPPVNNPINPPADNRRSNDARQNPPSNNPAQNKPADQRPIPRMNDIKISNNPPVNRNLPQRNITQPKPANPNPPVKRPENTNPNSQRPEVRKFNPPVAPKNNFQQRPLNNKQKRSQPAAVENSRKNKEVPKKEPQKKNPSEN